MLTTLSSCWPQEVKSANDFVITKHSFWKAAICLGIEIQQCILDISSLECSGGVLIFYFFSYFHAGIILSLIELTGKSHKENSRILAPVWESLPPLQHEGKARTRNERRNSHHEQRRRPVTFFLLFVHTVQYVEHLCFVVVTL